MNNKELFFRHIAQPTDFAAMNIDVERAEGIYIYDTTGKRYIDFISGISVSSLGHRNPKIIKAIKHQLDKYLHVMVYGEFIQSPQIQLAKKLSDVLPENLETTFFVNSGSEAIDGAIKLSKKHTNRNEIVAFKNAYHGSTLGAVSLYSDQIFKQPFLPLLSDIKLLNYNQIEELNQITEKTACVIVEPIQAASGVQVPDLEFIKQLRQKCTKTGTMLVFDEIQSGFGRTGKLFAFEHFGVSPDILCLGKAMGGGMPIGAFVSSNMIMDSLNSGHPLLGHATTFGGHPVVCSAALASLEILTGGNLISEVERKTLLFKSFQKSDKIKEIRGIGFFMGIDLDKADITVKVVEKCLKKGLIINWFLFNNQTLNIVPPLVITDDEIREVAEILNSVLEGV